MFGINTNYPHPSMRGNIGFFQTVTEWNTIELVNRGPGKLRKKSKKKKTRKRKRFGEEEEDCEDDEEWTMKNRGAGF